jgi:hypothetical protein
MTPPLAREPVQWHCQTRDSGRVTGQGQPSSPLSTNRIASHDMVGVRSLVQSHIIEMRKTKVQECRSPRSCQPAVSTLKLAARLQHVSAEDGRAECDE